MRVTFFHVVLREAFAHFLNALFVSHKLGDIYDIGTLLDFSRDLSSYCAIMVVPNLTTPGFVQEFAFW